MAPVQELIVLSLLAGLGFGLALGRGDLVLVVVFGGASAVTVIEANAVLHAPDTKHLRCRPAVRAAGIRWRDYDRFMQKYVKRISDERLTGGRPRRHSCARSRSL